MRQALVSMVQLFKPDDLVRVNGAMSDSWTDVRCVSELYTLQCEFDMKGVMPAHIY